MQIFAEAVAPLSVVLVCVPLFIYWLRMMHSLIVSDATAIEHSLRVASMVQMHYPDAMKRIEKGESSEDIYWKLREDLDFVRTMKADGSLWNGASPEVKVALAGFVVASWAYRVLRRTAFAGQKAAVLEMMVGSVRYLAGRMAVHPASTG